MQEMYDTNIDVVSVGENREEEQDAAVEKPNQFSCVAHRLQLVLKDVFEKDVNMINLRKVKFF